MRQIKANSLPPEVRDACLVLGIEPGPVRRDFRPCKLEETASAVSRAGDVTSARQLQSAKNTLIDWLRSTRLWCTPSQNPNQTGTISNDPFWKPPPNEPDDTARVPKPHLPTAGAGEIALLLPEPDEPFAID